MARRLQLIRRFGSASLSAIHCAAATLWQKARNPGWFRFLIRVSKIPAVVAACLTIAGYFCHAPKPPRILELAPATAPACTLGTTLPPRYQIRVTSPTEHLSMEIAVKKQHEEAEAWHLLDNKDIVSTSNGLVTDYSVDTSQVVESYVGHGESTPHGIYRIQARATDENGEDEKYGSFNYVFRLTGPYIKRFLEPVQNKNFLNEEGMVVYRAMDCRKGYSSSNVWQAFDLNSHCVIQGSFTLDCSSQAPCSLQIGLCAKGAQNRLHPQLSFIMGDGGLQRFSIKCRDDVNSSRKKWRTDDDSEGPSLIGDGRTLNHFYILVTERPHDHSQIECSIYLYVHSRDHFFWTEAFSRTLPKAYLPSPLFWLKICGWKRGSICLREFEMAEWDGEEIGGPSTFCEAHVRERPFLEVAAGDHPRF